MFINYAQKRSAGKLKKLDIIDNVNTEKIYNQMQKEMLQ